MIEFIDDNLQFIDFLFSVLKDTIRGSYYILKCINILDKIFKIGGELEYSTENPYSTRAMESIEWEGIESVQKHPSDDVYNAVSK